MANIFALFFFFILPFHFDIYISNIYRCAFVCVCIDYCNLKGNLPYCCRLSSSNFPSSKWQNSRTVQFMATNQKVNVRNEMLLWFNFVQFPFNALLEIRIKQGSNNNKPILPQTNFLFTNYRYYWSKPIEQLPSNKLCYINITSIVNSQSLIDYLNKGSWRARGKADFSICGQNDHRCLLNC